MRDILKIAGIYTALILGAGFASGREILFFFIRFGTKGFWGLILSGFIFSFIGYIVCDLANKKQIYMSDKFLSFIFQDFYCAAKFIIKIFLFFSYATMLSATGAFFQQQFAFKNIFGVLFMAILCFLIYFLGTNFMAKINFFLAPILFFGEIFVCVYIIFNRSQKVFSMQNNFLWIKNAILYSTHNLITAICVLVPIVKTLGKKNCAKTGAMLGGFFITLLGMIVGLVIFLNYKFAVKNQIPILAITKQISCKINLLYTILFILSILTTASGDFFALCEMFGKKKLIYGLIINLCGIIFAQIKFSDFISIFYPLFGFVGLCEIIFICWIYFSEIK